MTATREKNHLTTYKVKLFYLFSNGNIREIHGADVRRAISDDDNEIAQVKTFH